MGRFDSPKLPRDFYSGRMNERDALGEFRASAEGLRAFKEEANERGYIPRGRAIELVRKYTKEDPTNPSKPFSKELRLAVLDELGLVDDTDLDRVRVHTAVGTPLDVFHGVDGWIEFVPERGSPVVVTLDVTMDTGKLEHKADIIVQQFPDPTEDENEFLKIVQVHAREVARRMMPVVQDMLDRRDRAA